MYERTSLVVQWLRIHLPMQGTRVQSLVQEDATCFWATKPMHHILSQCSSAQELQLLSPCAWSLCVKIRETTVMRSLNATTG